MVAHRFEPPGGYPADVTLTIEDSGGAVVQRAEFSHAQLEEWAAGQAWSDEDYQARMTETVAREDAAQTQSALDEPTSPTA